MKRCIFVLFVIVFIGVVSASGELNLTDKEIAENCLNESASDISELAKLNISLIRFQDYYDRALNLYDAQIVLLNKNREGRFDNVISYCKQISDLREIAENSLDIYGVFLIFYHENIGSDTNASSVEEIVAQIEEEIAGERYENVEELINKGYEEIARVKAEQTTLALAYRTTSKTIKDFFINNWLQILIISCVVVVLYLFFRIRILLWFAKKKMESLVLRKDTVKGLIGQTQKDYFQTGKISEADYRMRTKNFADLMRDIERQIPLAQQEIARLSMRWDKKNKTK